MTCSGDSPYYSIPRPNSPRERREPLMRRRERLVDLRERVSLVAFLPPMARELARLPLAPTRDLPSRSCWPVRLRASLRFVFLKLLFLSALVSYFDAPASWRAIAIACLRLLTLPPLPLRPLLSSPCLNSCMTRPVVFRCRGDVLAILPLLPDELAFRKRRYIAKVPK